MASDLENDWANNLGDNPDDVYDAIVVGSGPAGALIAGELAAQGLKVLGVTAQPIRSPWGNTYGIWRDELEALGLTELLKYSWDHCVSYFANGEVNHDRSYGVIDKTKLQNYLLDRCEQGQVKWQVGFASEIKHLSDRSLVSLRSGEVLQGRVVVDASGHKPVFVERDYSYPVAYQAAYGIVGRFSKPPVQDGQFVLMDFRSEHLSEADRKSHPPTFVYAMEFEKGIYFVEETSLSSAPAVSFEVLEERLMKRLSAAGIEVLEVQDVERCLFPMNLPMPDFNQPVVAFGGAASMVHPASGYSIGAQLRRAPDLAQAIAKALRNNPQATPQDLATAGWKGLWHPDRLRKYYLYRFGLEKLMRFDEVKLQHFFDTFFSLPRSRWAGFLADGLSTTELVFAMMRLFMQAPNDVRWGLMQFPGQEAALFWSFITVTSSL